MRKSPGEWSYRGILMSDVVSKPVEKAEQNKLHLSRKKKFVFIVVTLCLALAACDVLCRILYPFITPVRGRKAVEWLQGKRPRLMVMQHPLMHYMNTPGWQDDNGINRHNSLGYRGPEVEEGDIRILCLGGSTTYCDDIANPEKAWPLVLGAILSERTGRKIVSINGGLSSATSAELFLSYTFRGSSLKPDIVILHTGINDACTLLVPGYEPNYIHYRTGWREPAGRRYYERTILKFGFAKVVYAWWMRGLSIDRTTGQNVPLNSLDPEDARQLVSNTEPEGYARNLDYLVRNIKADGGIPILFKPVLASKDVIDKLPPERAHMRKIFGPFSSAVEKSKKVNDVTGKKHGCMVVEMTSDDFKTGSFLDHCHLDASGSRTKAEFLANTIEPVVVSLLKNRPVKSSR